MTTNGLSEQQPERPRPRPRGRPTRLTPLLADALVAGVRQTGFITPATERCGLPDAVVHEWVQRGTGTHPTRPGTRPYAEFAARIARAQGEWQAHLLDVIATAAVTKPDTWGAAGWLLERFDRETYGRRERIDRSGTITLEEAHGMLVAVVDLVHATCRGCAKRPKSPISSPPLRRPGRGSSCPTGHGRPPCRRTAGRPDRGAPSWTTRRYRSPRCGRWSTASSTSSSGTCRPSGGKSCCSISSRAPPRWRPCCSPAGHRRCGIERAAPRPRTMFGAVAMVSAPIAISLPPTMVGLADSGGVLAGRDARVTGSSRIGGAHACRDHSDRRRVRRWTPVSLARTSAPSTAPEHQIPIDAVECRFSCERGEDPRASVQCRNLLLCKRLAEKAGIEKRVHPHGPCGTAGRSPRRRPARR